MSTTDNNGIRTNNSSNLLSDSLTETFVENNSINEAPITHISTVNDNASSLPWIDSINRLDRALSDSLWYLCYKIIDAILLSLGLYYDTKTCSTSNTLVKISICLLASTGLELFIILILFVRNRFFRRMTLSEEVSSNRHYLGFYLRKSFMFFKFIVVCVGTVHLLGSKLEKSDSNCEILRFCIGLVCFSTWWIMFNPSPSIILFPRRRSLITEIVIFLSGNIFFMIYIGLVLSPMIENQESECKFTHINDLYFHAPLKRFAFVGVTLLSLTIGISLLYSINAQLLYRYPNSRRIFIRLSVMIFLIAQLIALAYVYYLSVGAVLLFRPRSGGSCAKKARKLFKILHVWEIIQFLSPILYVLTTVLIGSLGGILGFCLTACLPAHISVPLTEFFTYDGTDAPISSNSHPNSPASPGTIDALPMIMFSQASDKFNQSSCTICRADFGTNEEVKRLPCGHFFHADCVGHWLSISRICPVCRQRVSLQRL